MLQNLNVIYYASTFEIKSIQMRKKALGRLKIISEVQVTFW
jgi:hypothetical protein